MGEQAGNVSRRDFMRTAVASGAAVGGLTILRATAKGAGRVFKVGLIGCGGRGNGALNQHVEAARILNDALKLGIGIKVVATADWFKSRAERAGQRYEVPKARCFGGPLAYRKLVETDADTVLMATAPAFRPVHFAACIEAGKHVFMEKPVAVDPPGCRRVIEAGELAKKKGLMVVAGTQRRHQKGYIHTAAAIREGAFGKVLGGRVAWNMGHMFTRGNINPRNSSHLVGSWQNWVHLSGDHICEQHVHNLDIMNWFLGTHPLNATGFGGRAQRRGGTQYDFFSIDFEFPGGVHVHSMCRQASNCWNWVGESFTAEKGRVGGRGPKQSPVPAELPQRGGGHQQEHTNMLYYLVKGKYLNEAKNVAWATAAAVMGRHTCYTGQRIEWRDMMDDPKRKPQLYNLRLKPTAQDYEKGEVVLSKDNDIPVPGRD